MDFYSKIKYQETRLTSDVHVNYLWQKMSGEDNQLINHEASEQYSNHVPIKFSEFLYECVELLNKETLEEINFELCDKKYLVSLLLTGLEESDVPAECQSVPFQASVLFLTLGSIDNGSVLSLDTVAFEYLLNEVLCCLKRRISYNYETSCCMILCVNKFLGETNVANKYMNQFLYLLRDALDDSAVVVDNFELDNQASRCRNKSIFICFKTVLEGNYSPQQRKLLVTKVTLILVEYVNSNTNIRQTIKYFFKCVLHRYVSETWYIILLTVIMERLTSSEFFVHIINEIPSTDHYSSLTQAVINHYVKCPVKNIDKDLDVLFNIINVPHQRIPDEVREVLVKRIIKQIFLKAADEDLSVKEKIMTVFIRLFKLRDLHVRRFLQQMFRDDITNKISSKLLFGLLQEDVDVKWKRSAYNTNFIILTCEMFIVNREFISAYRLKVVEMLCLKATAFNLKPTVSTIADLIRKYATQNSSVIRPMLRILVENALKPSMVTNYYVKEVFGLISDIMIATVDGHEELAICNVILTDDFDFMNLFKTFESQNLITNKHLQALLDEKSLKRNPVVWKLLSVLLDFHDYCLFPPYLKYTLDGCTMVDFYGKPEALYFLQVVCKIFSKKSKQSVLTAEDKSLAATMESTFSEHVKLHQVPMKHIGDVIVLLLTLQKITRSDTEWMKTLFFSLDKLLYEVYSKSCAVILQRYLVYMTKIFTLTDFKLDQVYINRLKKSMQTESQETIGACDGMTWGLVITFYGKVCLKYPEIINPSMPLLQFALIHGTPYVQQMTIYTIYDICNLQLSYFEPFEPGLLYLVANENIDVRSTATRMLIRLINDDHIRLNCTDFIMFISVLMDGHMKLCLYFKEIIEKEFLHRNQNTIAKYFIHLLLYLNDYKDHPLFPVDSKLQSREYNDEKRSMVCKLLFGHLQRYSQFQILNVLNNEILDRIHTGRMAPTNTVFNIFRDITDLVQLVALEYINEDVKADSLFYGKLFTNIKKDFFNRRRSVEMAELEFNKIVENLMSTLLNVLYKIERLNKDFMPLLFNVIAVSTKAFYDKLMNIMCDTPKLRDLYYELPNFYEKYKVMITSQPVSELVTWEKEEWRLHLGCEL